MASILENTAFILLVCFTFTIILNLGIKLFAWLFNTVNVHIIDGMINSKQLFVVPQDPSVSNSVTIYRSNDQQGGIEFTWSIWVFIDDLTYNEGKYKHVFSKGDNNSTDNGKMSLNNAPGLYINPNTNDMTVFMNTFINPGTTDKSMIEEEVVIKDVPMNKWFNVIIKCQNKDLIVYVNGMVANSIKLHNVPKQNYGSIYMSNNGGFSGNTSNLWYYSYALSSIEIQNLVKNGPNTSIVSGSTINQKNADYLSLRWYFNK